MIVLLSPDRRYRIWCRLRHQPIHRLRPHPLRRLRHHPHHRLRHQPPRATILPRAIAIRIWESIITAKGTMTAMTLRTRPGPTALQWAAALRMEIVDIDRIVIPIRRRMRTQSNCAAAGAIDCALSRRWWTNGGPREGAAITILRTNGRRMNAQ